MSISLHRQEEVLIVGATSGIARAVAQVYANRGVGRLILAGRDLDALEKDAADLRVRHQAEVEVRAYDAMNPDAIDTLLEGLPFINYAVLCHGIMLDNDTARDDPEAHRRMIAINYTSYALLMERLAGLMQDRAEPGGVIAVLSSVAGDRGRGSNYCYGATKAALTAYADGLRGRLHGSGVHVLTVKPGPTDTPMTHGLKAKGPTTSPDVVARHIVKDIDRRHNTCYTPRKWWPIMTIIRAIPEWVFKRTSL